MNSGFKNPYKPGAGHMPPHLAGRENEFREFERLLTQETILENLVLTGLRGVGKTVLLEKFKPRALEEGWLWVGADLSESASVSEKSLMSRLLADLAVATSNIGVPVEARRVGFGSDAEEKVPLSYEVLSKVADSTPGLVSDKIKAVLELVWDVLSVSDGPNKVVFAYDEAQTLSDYEGRDEFPLSVLLDVFQSIQKKNIPFMLVLTGLPTLFPKLVEKRTFSERMFRVITVGRLSGAESKEAVEKPLEVASCPIRLDEPSVVTICREAGGYPYFIQFICREVFDIFIQQRGKGQRAVVPVDAIQRKLDEDFFAGRWARVTDRQRQLLWVVAALDHQNEEFTIQELVAKSQEVLEKPFSSSHASQMLVSLAEHGLIYKNRFGKYSFAVPLLGQFISRNFDSPFEV